MKIDIKVIGGFLPEWSDSGDAGLDLRASEDIVLRPSDVFREVIYRNPNGETKRIVAPVIHNYVVPLGIQTQFAGSFVAIIKDRSSLASKGIYTSGGVIDSSYRGEWKVLLRNTSAVDFKINRGDRIAQVLFLPILHLNVIETQSLSETARGARGFGSTGVQ